mmetsp:Transcript_13611/g.17933  ORF Transcript_13611/g.17933 Transcript_13611/m.17933 type:complete len:245 (+) Transcript_13611:207-941(+)|eukprot:CAMPEP_0117757930 /NCGR_PEP_ID=MMETSP0947-20121206/15057_1 /TAXON_ID=44440 /ORGANISM="Chattonella subsalsa, Strain CCMP2191" /LENGTH=244 /DNA_ID=CAMNT_0005577983 /DNA_START=108 /DNA_END=842 /DNA_ORIENTATION=+
MQKQSGDQQSQSTLNAALPSEVYNYNGKLLSAQQRKKQALNDAQLLQNRIALLKKEEERAWRKIHQTKSRAQEILKLREDNERKMEERMQAAMAANEAQQKMAEQNKIQEEIARRNRAAQIEKMYKEKRQKVNEVRQEKQNIRRELMDQRENEVLKNRRQREYIVAHEQEVRERRERERQQKLEENKVNYECKVKQQHFESRQKEKEVEKLERIEMELIQKLKSTQLLQQNAYSELESALNEEH